VTGLSDGLAGVSCCPLTSSWRWSTGPRRESLMSLTYTRYSTQPSTLCGTVVKWVISAF